MTPEREIPTEQGNNHQSVHPEFDPETGLPWTQAVLYKNRRAEQQEHQKAIRKGSLKKAKRERSRKKH